MKNELVSVLMTVYKESKEELKKSFESIINQTYKNLEIIIVIDNPEDDWRSSFINSYGDKRVILLKNSNNMGLPLSLNRALDMAKGSFIARMDADDESRLDRIEKQVSYIKKYNFDLIGTYITFTYKGKIQEVAKFPSDPNSIRKYLGYRSAVIHPTWLVRSNVFRQLKGYRNIPTAEDYDLLMRAALHGYKISNVPEVLFDYSLSENSISRSNPGKQELIAEYLRKAYKKGTSPKKADIDEYLKMPSFRRKVVKYNQYCGLKDKRARCKAKKTFVYYVYSLRLLLNIRHSLKDIIKKFMINRIMSNDIVLEAA